MGDFVMRYGIGGPGAIARSFVRTLHRLQEENLCISTKELIQLALETWHKRNPKRPLKYAVMLESAGGSIAQLCLEIYILKSRKQGVEISKAAQRSALKVIREELMKHYPDGAK